MLFVYLVSTQACFYIFMIIKYILPYVLRVLIVALFLFGKSDFVSELVGLCWSLFPTAISRWNAMRLEAIYVNKKECKKKCLRSKVSEASHNATVWSIISVHYSNRACLFLPTLHPLVRKLVHLGCKMIDQRVVCFKIGSL